MNQSDDTLLEILRLEYKIQVYTNKIQYDYSATTEDKSLMNEKIDTYQLQLDQLRKGGKDD